MQSRQAGLCSVSLSAQNVRQDGNALFRFLVCDGERRQRARSAAVSTSSPSSSAALPRRWLSCHEGQCRSSDPDR